MTMREFDFKVIQPGFRLDKFVAEQVAEISRSQAQKLIEDGFVTINDQPQKASYKVIAGDRVRVKIPPPSPSHLLPLKIDVPIIYEDDDVLVVDKPAGLTVHPAPGYKGPTLINAVLSHLYKFDPDIPRPGIVHRLDKDTSGVMVVARHPSALVKIASQFKEHTVRKVYLALVHGKLTPEHGIIEAPIGRDNIDRTKMAISTENRGRKARTQYKVLRYFGDNTLLEAMPETGRTHQIRVHLAAVGHAIIGDAVYGKKSPLLGRQFLHAHKLGFNLPSSGQRVEFESPLPADLAQMLKLLS